MVECKRAGKAVFMVWQSKTKMACLEFATSRRIFDDLLLVSRRPSMALGLDGLNNDGG